ncbi:PilN domain-containing protein [Tissierella praeacuta]|uniref:PilN domain-containing protein n=1 Tax=Tissierella praeacuta TaxID=43131 RepID=UPI001052138C|nr:PilN domain-containing protein [Tissierella praeacuta]MBU5254901.1 PilN domain-containing protein [Tissierella praeacuta]TCU72799.1 type IV pilus assembly protein PilN [Tissierella praeacuta]
MRDLNFFEIYIEKKEIKVDKKILYFTVLISAIILLLIYTIYSEIVIRRETKTIKNLKIIAEDPKILKKVDDIREKEIEVNQFRESVEKLRLLDMAIEKRNIVDKDLLDKINDNIPKEIFLTSLSIQGGDIYIVGMSKDKWAIAEFQKGLESLEDCEEIFVSNISKQEEHYNFSLNITLVGVNDDGEVVEEENQNERIN